MFIIINWNDDVVVYMMIMMFKEFQGEICDGDGCGDIVSVCLDMREY